MPLGGAAYLRIRRHFPWSFPLAVRKKKPKDNRAQRTAAETKQPEPARADFEKLPSIALLAILTFASGCTALVFQVAWMREFRLVFGVTTASVAAVLAIFMAGLGFGSAILGKWADRTANPLRMYGLLEAAIALSVALTPGLISLISAIYIGLGGQESLGIVGATVVRLALASLVMAVPTFLMGGTLPAAVRSVTRTSDQNRLALGILYGSNTLGAVFGAFAATFFALEYLGTRATLSVGCALGLFVGTIAIVCSRGLTLAPSNNDEADQADGLAKRTSIETSNPMSGDYFDRFHRGLLYVTAAVLGFAFFALELVWYRMLGPILGGTTFTFGLILCSALVGIGLGGIAYNVIFRRLKPTWSLLAITCGLEAFFTIGPYALGDRLALIAAWRASTAGSFGQLVFGWSIVTAIVVFPAAFVSGVQFPLLIALLGQGRRSVSRHIGTTYAWNTLGSIAGSLIAGFGGLPLLTAPGMWQAIAILLAGISLLVLVRAPRLEFRSAILVSALVLATIGCSFTQGPTSAWRHSGIGAGRTIVPSRSEPNHLQQWLNEKRHTIAWEADGIESSVGIDDREGLAFIVNGKSDGNALSDAGTQTGASIIGATLHKDPKTALVIGLGTGESAGWLAQMRQIHHVDVVELEPAIDEMASRCKDLNWDVLNHPRVRRIYNDGREHVLTTADRYDVIISEPSNPYRAGIATLYTTEFYQAIRNRLNPGGIFVQWLQAYEIDAATVDIVLGTVGSEFEHVEVWQTLAADLQLVCSAKPLHYTADELRERIQSPGIKDALATTWMAYDLESFLAHFAANPRWAKDMAQSPFVQRNTDDCTALEYRFAKTVGRLVPFSIEQVRYELSRSGGHRPLLNDLQIDWKAVELRRQQFNLLWDGQLSLAFLSDPQDQELVKALFAYRNKDFAEALKLWPEKYRHPTDSILQLILARCYADLGRIECLELLTSAESRHPTEAAGLRAIYHAKHREWSEAAKNFDQMYTLLAGSPWVVPTILDAAFSKTVEVAKSDGEAAKNIYVHLSQPFASDCFNYVRQLARIFVAEQIGSGQVVEALRDWEPNVPWTSDILPMRAKAYADTGHPLASRAQRDWELFQRQQVVGPSPAGPQPEAK